MHQFFEICRCFKIVGILSQRQERYKFTYVTLTNCIFARFARAVFIFDNFAAVLFQSIFTPVFQPMRSESKTKTNRRLYAQFLPRFEQVTGDSYEFWLAHRAVCCCSDWSEYCFSTVVWKPLYGVAAFTFVLFFKLAESQARRGYQYSSPWNLFLLI